MPGGQDDFCPRVPQKRWTGAIEAALTCSTPKFRISGHTHRMLSLGALFRASTVRETHGLSRLMYDFVQRIQSNSAVQYTCDADMWYANGQAMHDGDKENRKTVSSADGCCKQPQYAQEQHVGGGANVTTGGRESSRSLPLSPLHSSPLPVVLPSLLNYASGPAPVDPAPIDNALGDNQRARTDGVDRAKIKLALQTYRPPANETQRKYVDVCALGKVLKAARKLKPPVLHLLEILSSSERDAGGYYYAHGYRKRGLGRFYAKGASAFERHRR
ncbi:hypothetical protein T492DRAFT_955764 [Pavlovales sp. CCMP2436]|nr:hypothetical protein T492DRAFT_955764 [Pavlovales sp. CCMP2436]